MPLAKDRDYTVRLRKRVDQEAQRYEIVFATANDAGPPPDGSHVRVAPIQGRWLIELGPERQGGPGHLRGVQRAGRSAPDLGGQPRAGRRGGILVRAMLQRTRERAASR